MVGLLLILLSSHHSVDYDNYGDDVHIKVKVKPVALYTYNALYMRDTQLLTASALRVNSWWHNLTHHPHGKPLVDLCVCLYCLMQNWGAVACKACKKSAVIICKGSPFLVSRPACTLHRMRQLSHRQFGTYNMKEGHLACKKLSGGILSWLSV